MLAQPDINRLEDLRKQEKELIQNGKKEEAKALRNQIRDLLRDSRDFDPRERPRRSEDHHRVFMKLRDEEMSARAEGNIEKANEIRDKIKKHMSSDKMRMPARDNVMSRMQERERMFEGRSKILYELLEKNKERLSEDQKATIKTEIEEYIAMEKVNANFERNMEQEHESLRDIRDAEERREKLEELKQQRKDSRDEMRNNMKNTRMKFDTIMRKLRDPPELR